MSTENFCEIIKKIYENPFAKVENLTVGNFYKLKEHVATCAECSRLTEELLEKHKDVPHESEWDKTKYN